jgi:hypothetical protein
VKKTLLIITWSIMMLHKITAQRKQGVENYNMLMPGSKNVWVPVIHFKGSKNFYAKASYNYEELNTASLYAGKTFEGGKKITYAVTPMAGVVFGKFKGVSAAANREINISELNFSAQMQYIISTVAKEENFFYNWCELSHNFLKKFYGGISLQQTLIYNNKMQTEAGALIGFNACNITIPLYVFNPLSAQRHFIAGFIIEWGQ